MNRGEQKVSVKKTLKKAELEAKKERIKKKIALAKARRLLRTKRAEEIKKKIELLKARRIAKQNAEEIKSLKQELAEIKALLQDVKTAVAGKPAEAEKKPAEETEKGDVVPSAEEAKKPEDVKSGEPVKLPQKEEAETGEAKPEEVKSEPEVESVEKIQQVVRRELAKALKFESVQAERPAINVEAIGGSGGVKSGLDVLNLFRKGVPTNEIVQLIVKGEINKYEGVRI